MNHLHRLCFFNGAKISLEVKVCTCLFLPTDRQQQGSYVWWGGGGHAVHCGGEGLSAGPSPGRCVIVSSGRSGPLFGLSVCLLCSFSCSCSASPRQLSLSPVVSKPISSLPALFFPHLCPATYLFRLYVFVSFCVGSSVHVCFYQFFQSTGDFLSLC